MSVHNEIRTVTRRIAEFVAWDLCPISVVDGQGFTRLLNYLEQGYKVPSCPYVTSICHKMFDSLKQELLAKLDSPFVSLTTDIWTSQTQQA